MKNFGREGVPFTPLVNAAVAVAPLALLTDFRAGSLCKADKKPSTRIISAGHPAQTQQRTNNKQRPCGACNTAEHVPKAIDLMDRILPIHCQFKSWPLERQRLNGLSSVPSRSGQIRNQSPRVSALPLQAVFPHVQRYSRPPTGRFEDCPSKGFPSHQLVGRGNGHPGM